MRKISIAAPVTIAIFLICTGVLVLTTFNPNLKQILASPAYAKDWYRYFTYCFVHANFEHYFGNMLYFLILSPSVEDRYGSIQYLILLVASILLTAVIGLILHCPSIGLSGIVFMVIVLNTFVSRDGSIPITSILVFLIYIGREVYNAFSADNVAQWAHISGGVLGFIYGAIFCSRKSDA